MKEDIVSEERDCELVSGRMPLPEEGQLLESAKQIKSSSSQSTIFPLFGRLWGDGKKYYLFPIFEYKRC